MLYLLISTLFKAIALLRLILIVQFLLGLALVFNLVSLRNGAVRTIWQGINALLDPLLNPIRRVLPMAGNLDFSPMILLMVLSLFSELFGSLLYLGM